MKQQTNRIFLLLVVVLFAVFLIYGMYFNAFGTNAQMTMTFFGIGEARQGLLLTVQGVGCLAVVLYLAFFGEKHNKLAGMLLGLGLMTASSLLIGTLPLYVQQGTGYYLMMGFWLLGGLGYILIDTLMNGVVADIFPEKKNTLLPVVHSFYGAGAMLAPPFAALAVNTQNAATFAAPYAILGIAGVIIFVPFLLVSRRVLPQTPYADMSALRKRAQENPAEVFRDSRAWLFLTAGVLFLYFQTGMSVWLPSYCTEMPGYDLASASLTLSMYFAGALVIRLLSPIVYKRIPAGKFYVLSMLAAMVMYLIIFLTRPAKALMMTLMGVGGLLLGSSVPGLVILCCDAFPKRTASASSLVVIAVSAASLTCPALMGWLIQRTGYIFPMLLITVCMGASALIVLKVMRLRR